MQLVFLFWGHCVRYLLILLRLDNCCVDSENYTPLVFDSLDGSDFFSEHALKKLNQIKNSRRFLTGA